MKIGFLNGASLGVMALVFLGIYIHLFKNMLDVSIPDFRVRWDFSGRCDGNLWFCRYDHPMFFYKIHIDPAVASGPLITTVNDLVAVITYYGLAMVFLIDIFHI